MREFIYREFDTTIWKNKLKHIQHIIDIKVLEDNSEFKNKLLCILFYHNGFKLHAVRNLEYLPSTNSAIDLIEETKDDFITLRKSTETNFLLDYIQDCHRFFNHSLIYDVDLLGDFSRYFNSSSYCVGDILKHIEQHKNITSYLNFVCQRF